MNAKQIENRMRNPLFAWRVNQLGNLFKGDAPTLDEVREVVWEENVIFPISEREEVAQTVYHFTKQMGAS